MKYKYPRTPHLPWSLGYTSDDIHLLDLTQFQNQHVTVTEKMDGENTTLYYDGLHARSLDSRYHPSRAWIRALQGQIGWKIPKGWRICGENLFARHSLAYDTLSSYFLVFSVWNENNCCLSWQETCSFAASLGLKTVPVMYSGIWDEHIVRNLSIDPVRQEGYVVRLSGAFLYSDFSKCIGKWVRKGHVTTDKHWMHSTMIMNKLEEDDNTN
ncbi:2'-5' RNA ligase [Vibrio sp. HA2012]|uniref:RNA ligase family protein n=1 Tax=Vibrio sp. HA2012 TaxID=1971595 RepID=UPI000C2B9FC3|nr:RNA ligase family protein [Vibrio sp. HA2012]PJC87385.1 2'-5' RNA ligase [Vibrio sp. HA2012]